MKTLGQVAYEAVDAAWSLPAEESWQAVADAVVAEYEDRQWREWPPDDEQRKVHAWREDAGVFLALIHQDEEDGAERWYADGGREDLSDDLPTHWTPIPAPPKEAKARESAPECPECGGSGTATSGPCVGCCLNREAAQPSAAEVKGIAAWLSDNHARTKDGKLCCVEVRRPDTHGGLCCTWKMKDFDIQAEMDGSEVGEEIVLRYVELTDAEFTALGDFDGW